MINHILEYLHNPQWLKLVILFALFILLVDGYLLPLIRRQRSRLAADLDRKQFDQAVIRMAWSRGAANFYFVISLIGIGLTYSSYVPNPDFRIVLNILIGAAIFYAFDNFRRALKIKRSLSA